MGKKLSIFIEAQFQQKYAKCFLFIYYYYYVWMIKLSCFSPVSDHLEI